MISETFHRLRLGGTPTLRTLKNGFEEATHHTDPTLHYLFTDGVPSDSTVSELKSFIRNRANPERNPLTLISCTNEDSECEWMKEVAFSTISYHPCFRLKKLLHLLRRLMIIMMKKMKLFMIKVQLSHILKDYGFYALLSVQSAQMILMRLMRIFPSRSIPWTSSLGGFTPSRNIAITGITTLMPKDMNPNIRNS